MSTKKRKQAPKRLRWLLGIQAVIASIAAIGSGIVKIQKSVAYTHEHGAETMRYLAPILYHVGAVTFSTYVRFILWGLIFGIPVLLIMKAANRKSKTTTDDQMIESLFKNPVFVLPVFFGCLVWSIYDQLTKPELAFTTKLTGLNIAVQLLGVLVLLWAAYAMSFIFKKTKDEDESDDAAE